MGMKSVEQKSRGESGGKEGKGETGSLPYSQIHESLGL